MAERPELSGGDFTNSRRLYMGAAGYCMGKKVFDFGCGRGHGTYLIHPYTLGITGFDLHGESVREARELFGSATCKYVDDFEGVYNNNTFDIVVSVEAIEHLEKEDLVTKLGQFKRMAPSIYATTPNGNFFPYQPQTKAQRRGYHVWHYTEDELKDLFGRFYEYVFIHGVLRDPNPAVNQFVGYAIFATNRIPAPPRDYLTAYKQRTER